MPRPSNTDLWAILRSLISNHGKRKLAITRGRCRRRRRRRVLQKPRQPAAAAAAAAAGVCCRSHGSTFGSAAAMEAAETEPGVKVADQEADVGQNEDMVQVAERSL